MGKELIKFDRRKKERKKRDRYVDMYQRSSKRKRTRKKRGGEEEKCGVARVRVRVRSAAQSRSEAPHEIAATSATNAFTPVGAFTPILAAPSNPDPGPSNPVTFPCV